GFPSSLNDALSPLLSPETHSRSCGDGVSWRFRAGLKFKRNCQPENREKIPPLVPDLRLFQNRPLAVSARAITIMALFFSCFSGAKYLTTCTCPTTIRVYKQYNFGSVIRTQVASATGAGNPWTNTVQSIIWNAGGQISFGRFLQQYSRSTNDNH